MPSGCWCLPHLRLWFSLLKSRLIYLTAYTTPPFECLIESPSTMCSRSAIPSPPTGTHHLSLPHLWDGNSFLRVAWTKKFLGNPWFCFFLHIKDLIYQEISFCPFKICPITYHHPLPLTWSPSMPLPHYLDGCSHFLVSPYPHLCRRIVTLTILVIWQVLV